MSGAGTEPEALLAQHQRSLLAIVDERAAGDGAAWLRTTAAGVADGDIDIRVAFPGVSRRVGRGGLGAAPTLEALVAGRRHPLSLAAWRIDDVARAALICAAASRGPVGPLVRDLYERGDARERTAALRALPLVAGASDEGVVIVLDAVRTNQGEIFEAAVCDNPYSGAWVPALEYRKAVLKAVFIGLAVERIALLHERADADLASSLLDLVLEREAASRPIAPALWPLMALYPPPGLAAKLLGYLEFPDPAQRAAAATALGTLAHAGDDRLLPFLHDRASREPDAAVKDAIARAVG
jgi:hypothetical protein